MRQTPGSAAKLKMIDVATRGVTTPDVSTPDVSTLDVSTPDLPTSDTATRSLIATAASANDQSACDERCHGDYKVSCSGCRLSTICIPIALQAPEIDRLDAIVQRGRPLRKGEYVFRQGESFTSVYAVRAGTLKTYATAGNGEEQITGFYLPGEIFGMDGLAKDRHASTAVALETAAICEIPFERLSELSTRIPSLQRHFFQLLSSEIAQDRNMIAMLGKHSAEQRIVALLLSISARNARRKLSGTAFRLPMSRSDIANYLGLTIETVSRIFGRLQKLGLVAAEQREIELLQPDQLRAMVHS